MSRTLKAIELWNELVRQTKEKEIEVPTNPIQENRNPKWFRVSISDGIIFVSNAQNHHPSSSISTPRKITFDEFQKIYPFYLDRKKGVAVSKEVTKETVNQVYHFGLMKYAEDKLLK